MAGLIRDAHRGVRKVWAGHPLAGRHPADLLAPVLLGALAYFYFWRLDAWLINDDEGSYLYAAWRISLGELPYRDFLTPQLPAFLMPGGLLMSLAGPDVWPARALAVALTLVAGVTVWATARRLFGPAVALIAGAGLLLHPDVYLDCRTFRSDPFMLLYSALGIYLFTRGAFPRPEEDDLPDRRWLAASGALFGLAVLSKLFGLLPLAGCLAWLVADAWRHGRGWRPVAADVVAVLVSCAAVVVLGLGAFYLTTPAVFEAVLGHHLRQGAGLGWAAVASKGAAFYLTYLRFNSNALMVFVAVIVGIGAWREGDRRAQLFAWQLPTALVFLGMSRELWPRHLIYVLPALLTLFALGIRWLGRMHDLGAGSGSGELGAGSWERGGPPDTRRWLAGALVAALFVPWALVDRDSGWRLEEGTRRLADFIGLVTAPDELVLSDYSELNFYARRPTTYSAASLSSGAAGSGQITWARLAGELEGTGQQPALLVVDRTGLGGPEYGHLRFLRDLGDFEAWKDTHYELAGTFRRDPQDYRIYTPRTRPLPVMARFADGPTLVAAGPDRARVGSGQSLDVLAAWRAEVPISAELITTLRLVDLGGMQWAQADDALRASRQRATDRWVAGELTSGRLAVTVPLGAPPGEYELRLGLYRRGDLGRLDVVDPEGLVLGQSVAVGRVQVEPWYASPEEAWRRAPMAEEYRDATGYLPLLGRGPLPAEPVEAGMVFPLDLWWHVPGGLGDEAVTVVLGREWSLHDPPVVAGGVSVPLGVPGAPASSWPPGIVVRQTVRVPVMAAAAGGRYRLRASHGSVLGEFGGGHPALFDLGSIDVVGRDTSTVVTEPPPVDVELHAVLGGVAALLGADVATRTEPGGALEVTLVWRAVAPSAVSYKVTVQLLDEAGRPVAQHDGEPADWTRPTRGWLPGEVVVDAHVLDMPADLPPGSYTLIAGLYDPDSLVRLPVTGADSAGDAVRVATVNVGS